MAYTVNDHFILLDGEPGDPGLGSTPTGPSGLWDGGPTARVGGPAPTGSVTGDLVVNSRTGELLQVDGPTLILSTRILTYPSIGSPRVYDTGNLIGVTGPTGDGGPFTHPSAHGDVGILYTPTNYLQMWEQSFIPLKPAAPTLPAALNLVSNVGNDIRVTMPPEVPAGMDHPFYDAAKVKPGHPPLPSVGYALLRVVVTRSATDPSLVTPFTPWLDVPQRVDYVDVWNPPAGQEIIASLPAAWPNSGTDTLWVTAFLWDEAGNGPSRSNTVKATVSFAAAVTPDSTPPHAPTVTVVWDPVNLQYTVTITAPNDPDLKELRIWQNPNNNIGTPNGITPVTVASAPGQVHTITFKPDSGAPAGYPPAGWKWVAGQPPHGVVKAGWYVIAYDQKGNGGSPGLATDYQPMTDIEKDPLPPPIIIPTQPGIDFPGDAGGGEIGVAFPPGFETLPPMPPRPVLPPTAITHSVAHADVSRAKSRAYAQSGSIADRQWGQGVMHTGRYGNTQGTQWCGTWIDLTEPGAQIESMVLHWTMTHTFAYDGGSFCLGWHSLRNGMPSKLPSNASGTHFGSLGHVRVPRTGGASKAIPDSIAQRMLDGQAFGFLFGGPHDHAQSTYTAIRISSVYVSYKYRK